MKGCPVCGNETATLVADGDKQSGVRRRNWLVQCPSCPTSFDVPLELLQQLGGSSVHASQLRARWVRLIAEAAKRGEKMTHLY